MKEIWKDVIGYEGLYRVSNQGKIKSNKRFHVRRDRTLNPSPDKDGYLRVTLIRNGKQSITKVHRLVLCSFIGKSELQCNHKNGVKTDNRIENLEWCTQSENQKHAHELGLHDRKGNNACNRKLTEDQVWRIKFIKKHTSQKKEYWRKISIAFGVSLSAIKNIIYEHTWRQVKV